MKNEKPHILMIMYGKSVGGAELQFIELANYLADKHSVRLVSLGGDGALRAAQIDDQIEIQTWFYNNKFSTLISLAGVLFSNLFYPSRHVATTSFIGDFLGWSIGIFRRRRLVSLQTVSKCMEHPVMDRFVLRRFDALIAGANDIKHYLISHDQDPSRIHVIHNWVDFSKRKPSASVPEIRRKLGLGEQLIIGCIGRLHPQKGQIYLIRAFANVLAEFSNTVLLLVGEGETREELENEVTRLGMTKRVIFTGTATGDEYNNLLSVIDVYVQPSVFEGLPRTLLDAMYMGKAIVATDINGNREAIENETNGLLVPAQDFAKFAQAISELLRNPEKMMRFSMRSINDAEQKFSMKQQLERIEHVIAGEKS